MRVDAEAAARRRNFKLMAAHEVSLDDIYDHMKGDADAKRQLMELELDVERSVISANPPMLDVYKYAVERKKTIVALSDMYLDAGFIKSLLEENQIFIDNVYCSSAFKKEDTGKYNGKMYDKLIADFNVQQAEIVHFGDNIKSDVEEPRKKGIVAVAIPIGRDELLRDKRFDPETIRLIERRGSLKSALIIGNIVKRRSEGTLFANVLQTVGYIYGGLLVFAFTKFIEQFAKENEIKKLLLLTRDCFVLKEAFDVIGFDAASYDMMYASRRMMVFPNFDLGQSWSTSVLFPPRQGTYNLADEFGRLGVDLDAKGRRARDYNELLKALRSYEGDLRRLARSEGEAVKAYFEQKLDGLAVENVALVDVGWGLNSHRGVDELCRETIKGAYVGIHSNAYDNGKVRGFLFDRDQHPEIHNILMGGAEIIEFMFSDPSPTVVRMDQIKGVMTPVFHYGSPMDHARSSLVSDARRGIIEFIKDFGPYYHLFDVKELTELCRATLVNLFTNPSTIEHDALGQIPHCRETGKGEFRPISDYWSSKRRPSHSNPMFRVRENPLFDADWIRLACDSPGMLMAECVEQHDIVGPNILFDPEFYRNSYGADIPDGMTCLEHFCSQTTARFYDPNALFSTRQWHETLGGQIPKGSDWLSELIQSLGSDLDSREKRGEGILTEQLS